MTREELIENIIAAISESMMPSPRGVPTPQTTYRIAKDVRNWAEKRQMNKRITALEKK